MCLLVLAWKVHPRYRLVAAANRDEFHARPAAPLGWWSDAPQVLAGRDLQGGGAWMGLSRAGRFGVVTNFRDLERPPAAGAPTRGALVADYLSGTTPAADYVAAVADRATGYSGFNLLLGDADRLCYIANRTGGAARELPPGIYGLSNHLLDSPWPKLLRTRERFAAALATTATDALPGTLFDLLADRTTADPDETPETGLPPEWERALSAPFVVHEGYGTRCSTVVLTGADGAAVAYERRFDARGTLTGATRLATGGTPP